MADVKNINGYDIKDAVARNQNTYNSSEIEVGTYNGAKLYRKSWFNVDISQLTPLASGTNNKIYSIGTISDASKVKRVYGCIKTSTVMYPIFMYTDGGADRYVSAYCSGTSLRLDLGNYYNLSGLTVDITIEYVK